MMSNGSMPRRVLITCDSIGGVWTYALELAHALGEFDIRVALATMGAPLTSRQLHAVKQIPNVSLFESEFKLEWMDDPWDDVAIAGEWLLHIEDYFQPDVVHLGSYVHAALPWRVPVVTVGHSCVLSWWMAVRGEPPPESLDRYRSEVMRGLRASSAVAAPTRAMLSTLGDLYGPLPPGKVIPNGRSADIFQPGTKEPFIFSAGRIWDEAKNMKALDRAAPSVPWPIVVAGEARHPEGGTACYREIFPLGNLPTSMIAFWFARASIFALPALYEPFGLTVLEAALSGCALVLGDIASLRETWDGAAVFVAPDDTEHIEDALNTLVHDASYRARMSECARARAAEFTAERMAKSYVDLYAELIGSERVGLQCA